MPLAGVLAANFGRSALDALGVKSPVARGLAMGAVGHGIGTAAMASEKEAFPFAGERTAFSCGGGVAVVVLLLLIVVVVVGGGVGGATAGG